MGKSKILSNITGILPIMIMTVIVNIILVSLMSPYFAVVTTATENLTGSEAQMAGLMTLFYIILILVFNVVVLMGIVKLMD